MLSQAITIPADQGGAARTAILRSRRPGQSWNQMRRMIETRHARGNGELGLDPARGLMEGKAEDCRRSGRSLDGGSGTAVQ